MELFTNRAQTLGSASIDVGGSSLSVVSASAFPTSGNFHIKVEDEIMLVTAVSGTTFTVTKAQDNTADFAHPVGSLVTLVLTKASLAAYRSDSLIINAIASRPAAGHVGRLSLSNDAVYLGRDNGATWDNHGPIWPITKQIIGNMAWVNQGSATGADTHAGIHLAKGTSSGEDTRILERNTPSPPYVITALLIPNTPMDDYAGCGLCWRNSSSGKIINSTWYCNAKKFYFANRYMNSPTSYNSGGNIVSHHPQSRLWMRLSDDNTNRKFFYSFDGFNWIELASEARTNFITPDRVGFFVWTIGQTAAATLSSWIEI